MHKNLKIALGAFCVISSVLFTNCDNRKDIVPALEQSASFTPIIQLRRHNSGQAYVTNFIDTTLIGTTGYRLDYRVTGNADLSTLTFSCVTGCPNVTYCQIKQDSGFVLLFVNNGYTVTFSMTVANKFSQLACSNFSLTTFDQTPVLAINNYNYVLPFAVNLYDTIKTTVNPVYMVGYQLTGNNVSAGNIFVKRMTPGDGNPFTIGSQIKFNYSSVSIPTAYSYKIYAVDPLGKTSDTCYFNIYAFKNMPPVFDALVSASCASAAMQETDSYLSAYLGGQGPLWNAFPVTIGMNAHEAEQRFGGYIQKIRWRIRYTNIYASENFDQTFINTYTSLNTNFTLNFDSPWYSAYMSWGGVYSTLYLSGSLIDNNNDSTFFSATVTF
jgi:hypothetical protein